LAEIRGQTRPKHTFNGGDDAMQNCGLRPLLRQTQGAGEQRRGGDGREEISDDCEHEKDRCKVGWQSPEKGSGPV
jgi:hypothetical protein